MEGASSLQSMIWGNLEHHCPGSQNPPIAARTSLVTYLNETFMNRQIPRLPWSSADPKHPWCLEDGDTYEAVPVVAERIELCLVCDVQGVDVPPVVNVPVEPKYLSSVPALRFGVVDGLALTNAALEEIVRPSYPQINGHTKACIVDVRMSFAIDGSSDHGDSERSWFDGSLFLRGDVSIEPALGSRVDLTMRSAYVDHLRRTYR
jgi:hypothetical protein